jgi:hypothetical protein
VSLEEFVGAQIRELETRKLFEDWRPCSISIYKALGGKLFPERTLGSWFFGSWFYQLFGNKESAGKAVISTSEIRENILSFVPVLNNEFEREVMEGLWLMGIGENCAFTKTPCMPLANSLLPWGPYTWESRPNQQGQYPVRKSVELTTKAFYLNGLVMCPFNRITLEGYRPDTDLRDVYVPLVSGLIETVSVQSGSAVPPGVEAREIEVTESEYYDNPPLTDPNFNERVEANWVAAKDTGRSIYLINVQGLNERLKEEFKIQLLKILREKTKTELNRYVSLQPKFYTLHRAEDGTWRNRYTDPCTLIPNSVNGRLIGTFTLEIPEPSNEWGTYTVLPLVYKSIEVNGTNLPPETTREHKAHYPWLKLDGIEKVLDPQTFALTVFVS